MVYDPEKHHRRSIRLQTHDYAGGGTYFVTLCAHREFVQAAGGRPFDEVMRKIIEEEWRRSGEIRQDVFLGEFVVMPDHFHGLIRIEKGASELGHVVGAFKAAVSRRCRGDMRVARTVGKDSAPMRIWHRNYYEMIVRSKEAEEKIAEYIKMNPWNCVQNFGSGLRGIGNPALWNAEKLGVLCSRKTPKIGTLPDADVYFGGWHSPKEKEILAWLLQKGKRIIACPAWGIERAGYAPGFADALQENRMLILEMRNREGDLAAAEQRNRFVIENANALFVPYVTQGGMLERLLNSQTPETIRNKK